MQYPGETSREKKYTIALDRNSTSFAQQVANYMKNVTWSSEMEFLKYYQNITRAYMNDVSIDSRGLLCYLTMGLGKSILAISIAMDMMRERQVIILLAKSLEANMRESIHKYINLRALNEPSYFLAQMDFEAREKWISTNFKFVSMNASNMTTQMQKAAMSSGLIEDLVLEERIKEVTKLSSLDGKLLIVDEAHNLFRAITNGSENGLQLYNAIMNSKNLKILFFTGTPISNDPFEAVPCFNMLGSRMPNRPIFPQDFDEFYRLYVDSETNTIKNRDKFQNRILGLISYVSHMSTPGASVGRSVDFNTDFPEQYPIIEVLVPMSTNQYVDYGLARDQEDSEANYGRQGNAAAMQKPKTMGSSTYRSKTRQLSNYALPREVSKVMDVDEIPLEHTWSPKFEAILKNIESHENQLGIVYSQWTELGGIKVFARYLMSRGWARYKGGGSETSKTGGCDECWPDSAHAHNCECILCAPSNDLKTGGDENEFSLFTGGAEDDAANVNKDGATPQNVFAIVDGSVPVAMRNEIVATYNDKRNTNGASIKLLLISATGAEGLDLKRVRHVHIMEPYWTENRHLQTIFRGVRNGSHADMPADARNVQPYIYLSVPPEAESKKSKTKIETTDTEIYKMSKLGYHLIDSFLKAYREVSIECIHNKGDHCYNCQPTDEKLFGDNARADISKPNPCRTFYEKQVEAREVKYKGETYNYVASDATPQGYIIYKFDKSIGKHTPLKENEIIFMEIIDEIERLANQ